MIANFKPQVNKIKEAVQTGLGLSLHFFFVMFILCSPSEPLVTLGLAAMSIAHLNLSGFFCLAEFS